MSDYTLVSQGTTAKQTQSENAQLNNQILQELGNDSVQQNVEDQPSYDGASLVSLTQRANEDSDAEGVLAHYTSKIAQICQKEKPNIAQINRLKSQMDNYIQVIMQNQQQRPGWAKQIIQLNNLQDELEEYTREYEQKQKESQQATSSIVSGNQTSVANKIANLVIQEQPMFQNIEPQRQIASKRTSNEISPRDSNDGQVIQHIPPVQDQVGTSQVHQQDNQPDYELFVPENVGQYGIQTVPTLFTTQNLADYIEIGSEFVDIYNQDDGSRMNPMDLPEHHKFYLGFTGTNLHYVRRTSSMHDVREISFSSDNDTLGKELAEYFMNVLDSPRTIAGYAQYVLPNCNPYFNYPFTHYRPVDELQRLRPIADRQLSRAQENYDNIYGDKNFDIKIKPQDKALTMLFEDGQIRYIHVSFNIYSQTLNNNNGLLPAYQLSSYDTAGIFFMANEVPAEGLTFENHTKEDIEQFTRWTPVVNECGLKTRAFLGYCPSVRAMTLSLQALKNNFGPAMTREKVTIRIVGERLPVPNEELPPPSAYEAIVDRYCLFVSSSIYQVPDGYTRSIQYDKGVGMIWPGGIWYKQFETKGLKGHNIKRMPKFYNVRLQDDSIYRFVNGQWQIKEFNRADFNPDMEFGHLRLGSTYQLDAQLLDQQVIEDHLYTFSHYTHRDFDILTERRAVLQFRPLLPLSNTKYRNTNDVLQYHAAMFLDGDIVYPAHWIICSRTIATHMSDRVDQLNSYLKMLKSHYINIAMCYDWYEQVSFYDSQVGEPILRITEYQPPRKMGVDPITLILHTDAFDMEPPAYRYLYFLNLQPYARPETIPATNAFKRFGRAAGGNYDRGLVNVVNGYQTKISSADNVTRKRLLKQFTQWRAHNGPPPDYRAFRQNTEYRVNYEYVGLREEQSSSADFDNVETE